MKKAPKNQKKKSKLVLTPTQKRIIKLGALTLPISLGVGHVLGNVVRRQVPFEPAPTAIVRTTEHPSMRKVPKKQKPKKQKSTKPIIDSELHERWAGMVLGEVGHDAPEEVWRKTARTVMARKEMPGWRNQEHNEILNSGQFHALGSSTLETRKQRHLEEFNRIKKIIKEEHGKKVTPTDATHFYTTRLLVDGKGKYILDKEGNPIETNTNVPEWATNHSFMGDEVWQPTGEPVDKGPVRIKFYRHKS